MNPSIEIYQDQVTRSAIVGAKRYSVALGLSGLMRQWGPFTVASVARASLECWPSEVAQALKDQLKREEVSYNEYLATLPLHTRGTLLRQEACWVAKVTLENPNPFVPIQSHGVYQRNKFLQEHWVEFVPREFREEMRAWGKNKSQ